MGWGHGDEWGCKTYLWSKIKARGTVSRRILLTTSSVQFSRSVVCGFLQPHGLQHAGLSCPSLTLGACSNSCPRSQWCHSTISSSVVPFSCLQSFPVSGSFLMSQFFASGGQSNGVSPTVLPMNIQDWSLEWTGWISSQSKGLSRVFNTTVQKHQSFGVQSNCHIHTWSLEKPKPWLDAPLFVDKVMSLLFNMLSKSVITFLLRSKHLLISWLQSPSALILEPRKIVWHCFHCFPIYLPWSDGTRCHDLRFLNVEL